MGSPLVVQFKKGGVSKDVRLTAASGALPLTPSDQVELLFLLTHDRDEEVSSTAETSLTAMPDADLVAVLKEATTPERVLNFFAERTESDDVHQAIVRNANTPDATVCRLVSRLTETNLEFIVVNQTRLLRHPPILKELEINGNLNSDQKRRIAELKHDFKLDRPDAPEPPPAPPEPEPLPKADLGEGPAEEEEPPPKNREEAMERFGVRDGDPGELDEEETKKKSIFERIFTMTASDKVMEGLKGDRDARMMLIKDRNRAVWSAVLSSPKMNDADAEAVSKMRNVSPDVLREVGKNRQWTKRYTVAHELVKNPKTPPEISSQLLARLSVRDLKGLTRDRNVPEMIRRQANKRTKLNK